MWYWVFLRSSDSVVILLPTPPGTLPTTPPCTHPTTPPGTPPTTPSGTTSPTTPCTMRCWGASKAICTTLEEFAASRVKCQSSTDWSTADRNSSGPLSTCASLTLPVESSVTSTDTE